MVQFTPSFDLSRLRTVPFALFVLVVSASQSGLAQDDYNPLTPPDTSSPRATLHSFIDGCNDLYDVIRATEHLNRRDQKYGPLAVYILDCLDQSELPEYARADLAGEAAVHLKEVLDRIQLPPDADIPDIDAIEQEGGKEEVLQWRIPGTRITIALVQEGPHYGQYLFSPDTVDRAADFYEYVRQMPYRTEGPKVSPGFREWYLSEPGTAAMAALVHMLPAWFAERGWGLAVWQWVGLTLTTLLALAAMCAIYRFARWRAVKMRETSVVRYCFTLIFLVIAMLVPLAYKYVTADYLTLRGTALYVTSFIANMVFLLALLVVIAGATSRLAEVIISSPRIQPRGLDAQLIRIVCRLLSIVAGIVVFLEGGRYLGIPLTTLLASAGVGGLAVALAAQDTLKSLFGSIMILLDKPYRVGERIIVGDYDGVVEEIGLRSTKLRLLTGHQAAIPNEEMAKSRIENVGRRPHIRRTSNLRIPLDTPREKVEQAITAIRQTLEDHEGMDVDYPPRVYFDEFNPDSFNIKIVYWYQPPNYWDFLAFSEKVNLAVFRAFDEQGIKFSLPFRITYTDPQSEPRPLELKMVDHRGREREGDR